MTILEQAISIARAAKQANDIHVRSFGSRYGAWAEDFDDVVEAAEAAHYRAYAIPRGRLSQ